MRAIFLLPALMAVLFITIIVLVGDCMGRKASQETMSGMLDQCQRDLDKVIEKCYGGKNGNN